MSRQIVQVRKYDSWVVLSDLLQREGVARQHLNSYNEFGAKGMQNIIDEIGEIQVETDRTSYKAKLARLSIAMPRVVELEGLGGNCLPMAARIRDLTDSSPMLLELTIE